MDWKRQVIQGAGAVAMIMLLSACMPQIQSNYKQLEARANKLETLLIMTPDVTINELGVGDVKEERPEWSEAGRENLLAAISPLVEESGRRSKILDPKTKFGRLVEEVQLLRPAVMRSIYDHAHIYQGNMEVFPPRIENFDYTLGSVKDLTQAYRADGMLLITGQDNISTSGRKALGVFRAINPFDGGQQGGLTFLELVLTDAKGDVLWWSVLANTGDYDLRQKDDAAKFLRDCFESFPERNL